MINDVKLWNVEWWRSDDINDKAKLKEQFHEANVAEGWLFSIVGDLIGWIVHLLTEYQLTRENTSMNFNEKNVVDTQLSSPH